MLCCFTLLLQLSQAKNGHDTGMAFMSDDNCRGDTTENSVDDKGVTRFLKGLSKISDCRPYGP